MAVAGRIRREIENECLPAGESYQNLDEAVDAAMLTASQKEQ